MSDQPTAERHSPTLPIFDNTAVSCFMTCPREYMFAHVEDWFTKGKTSAPLHFGTVWHTALETHYRHDGDFLAVEDAVNRGWGTADFGPDEFRTRQRLLSDYMRYLATYGRPTVEAATGQGKTVGEGDSLLLEIASNVTGGGLIRPWAVRLDRVFELVGGHYIEDHKTTSRMDGDYFSNFNLSNQIMGYTAVGQLLFPELDIRGVRVNVSYITKTKTEFLRQLFTYTPEQIAEWKETANAWTNRITTELMKYEMALANDYDPMTDSTIFPMHFGENGCVRRYGRCVFFPVCSASRPHRRRILNELFVKQPWNPLATTEPR